MKIELDNEILKQHFTDKEIENISENMKFKNNIMY